MAINKRERKTFRRVKVDSKDSVDIPNANKLDTESPELDVKESNVNSVLSADNVASVAGDGVALAQEQEFSPKEVVGLGSDNEDTGSNLSDSTLAANLEESASVDSVLSADAEKTNASGEVGLETKSDNAIASDTSLSSTNNDLAQVDSNLMASAENAEIDSSLTAAAELSAPVDSQLSDDDQHDAEIADASLQANQDVNSSDSTLKGDRDVAGVDSTLTGDGADTNANDANLSATNRSSASEDESSDDESEVITTKQKLDQKLALLSQTQKMSKRAYMLSQELSKQKTDSGAEVPSVTVKPKLELGDLSDRLVSRINESKWSALNNVSVTNQISNLRDALSKRTKP